MPKDSTNIFIIVKVRAGGEDTPDTYEDGPAYLKESDAEYDCEQLNKESKLTWVSYFVRYNKLYTEKQYD